jgi:hypothetical protein
MPRFVKWSKKRKTQEFWSIQLYSTGYQILEGDVRSGQALGPFTRCATYALAKQGHDAEVEKKRKSKFWTYVEVPEIPAQVGDAQQYQRADGRAWTIEIVDATTIETSANTWQVKDEVERLSRCELLIAERIATGYARIGGPPETTKFTATGYFEQT